MPKFDSWLRENIHESSICNLWLPLHNWHLHETRIQTAPFSAGAQLTFQILVAGGGGAVHKGGGSLEISGTFSSNFSYFWTKFTHHHVTTEIRLDALFPALKHFGTWDRLAVKSYLHLCVGPARHLDDHVEHRLVIVGVQWNVMEGRDVTVRALCKGSTDKDSSVTSPNHAQCHLSGHHTAVTPNQTAKKTTWFGDYAMLDLLIADYVFLCRLLCAKTQTRYLSRLKSQRRSLNLDLDLPIYQSNHFWHLLK